MLHRDTINSSNSSKPPRGQRPPQRYLVGLSLGPSSTALLHILTENARAQRARAGGQKAARFAYAAVHVVDDAASASPSAPDDALSAYRAQFPDAELVAVPLSAALDLPSACVDWAALPTPNTALAPAPRLADVLRRLPSATSRADVRRLLVRHLLVAAAAARACDALLLGCNTTTLAELTLAETAKGRGFSLPWLVNDGAVPVPTSLSLGASGAEATATTTASLPIYSPLRELFRKELVLYLTQTTPPLTGLTTLLSNGSSNGSGSGAVVSHRDQSIDDVLARYFGDVETNYPSVVANVVRTTGKLRRPGAGGRGADGGGGGEEIRCGLCGTSLDELGDERWRGEIGDRLEEEEEAGAEGAEAQAEANGQGRKPKLCYGCERSTRG